MQTFVERSDKGTIQAFVVDFRKGPFKWNFKKQLMVVGTQNGFDKKFADESLIVFIVFVVKHCGLAQQGLVEKQFSLTLLSLHNEKKRKRNSENDKVTVAKTMKIRLDFTKKEKPKLLS